MLLRRFLKTDGKDRIVITDNYTQINKKDLLPGDICLFLGGMKLTQFHGRNRKKKLGRTTLPPRHAAIVYKYIETEAGGDVIILDPEINNSLSFLNEYIKKSKTRIDIVRYKATATQRLKIQASIKVAAEKEKLYNPVRFLWFITEMPYVGWMFKWMKPTRSRPICSSESAKHPTQVGIIVSTKGKKWWKTAPVDIQIFGLRYHQMFTLKKEG